MAIRETTMPESCPLCGAPVYSYKISLREVAFSVVSACLLLSILIPAGLVVEHWMEAAGHRFVDRMIWREPVENWNQ